MGFCSGREQGVEELGKKGQLCKRDGFASMIGSLLSYLILHIESVLVVLALGQKLFFFRLGTSVGDKETASSLHHLDKIPKIGEPPFSIHTEKVVDGIIAVEEELTAIFLIQQVEIGGKLIQQLLGLRTDALIQLCIQRVLLVAHD
jgi:hypothetical protein